MKAGLNLFGKEILGRTANSFSEDPPIEPTEIDLNISWDDIRGLDNHVSSLKEMVLPACVS